MKNIQKILLINPFGIGDVLFTTPVVANIKKSKPHLSLSYLANARTAVFLRNDPRIDKVFVYERDEFVAKSGQSRVPFMKKGLVFFNQLRDEKFDCLIDFSMNRQFSFLAWLMGVPHRVGFDYKNRGQFLNYKIPFKGYEGRHVMDYYCDLLTLLDVPIQDKKLEIFLPKEMDGWTKTWFAQKGINGKAPIAVIPGGGASWGREAALKRWPAAKYAELVGKIVEKSVSPIILFGDKAEQSLCREIVAAVNSPFVIAAGETDILQFAALLGKCRLVVVNDGGPLHVAVALGVATVSVFGPVDPVVYGPYYLNPHIVVQKNLACQPCYRQFRISDCRHQQCLNSLSVDDVFRKVEEVL